MASPGFGQTGSSGQMHRFKVQIHMPGGGDPAILCTDCAQLVFNNSITVLKQYPNSEVTVNGITYKSAGEFPYPDKLNEMY